MVLDKRYITGQLKKKIRFNLTTQVFWLNWFNWGGEQFNPMFIIKKFLSELIVPQLIFHHINHKNDNVNIFQSFFTKSEKVNQVENLFHKIFFHQKLNIMYLNFMGAKNRREKNLKKKKTENFFS